MRQYLAALAVLLGAMLLYQGVVLGGFLAGAGAPVRAAPSALLLTAAGAMALAAATVRVVPGVAAVELLLAGMVVMGLAGPDHRYLLAYGGAALGLAPLAAIAALRAPHPARLVQPRDRHPGAQPAGMDAGCLPAAPSPVRLTRPARGAPHRVLRRVAAARDRRQAARQAWRTWPAGPPPGQEPHHRQPPPMSGAVLAAAEPAHVGSAGPSAGLE